jgi:hypothetical protein
MRVTASATSVSVKILAPVALTRPAQATAATAAPQNFLDAAPAEPTRIT